MQGPKEVFDLALKFIGGFIIVCIIMRLVRLGGYSGAGYAGLNGIFCIYMLIMAILGAYLLTNNNWFFSMGTRSIQGNQYTKRNMFIISLKIIGVILIVMQLNGILDALQFSISAHFYGLHHYIGSMVFSVALLLLGFVLLLYKTGDR